MSRRGSGFLIGAAVLAALAGTAGCGETRVPAATKNRAPLPFRLTDSAAALGLDFRHTHGTMKPLTIVEAIGSGGAVFDYDRDGWYDVFLVNAGQDFKKSRQTPGSRLFRNVRGERFEDVTASSGISVDTYAMGGAVGDYDNDGWEDLLVTGFGRNQLYRNQGGKGFQEVTRAVGIPDRPNAWGTSATFVDIDRDGVLELYILNYVKYDPAIPFCPHGKSMTGCTPNQYSTQRNELYVRGKDGKYVDRTVELGADDPAGAGLGVVHCDFDNDGWPDLFNANDGTPNALLKNVRGRFKNIAETAGVAYAENGVMRAGMGTDAGDYNGDGRFDLVITDFQHEPNTLYRNGPGMIFDETTSPSGIGVPTIPRLGFGVSFVDLDQDGKSDLYFGNGHVYDNVSEVDDTATFAQQDQILRNEGNGRFKEILPESGAFPVHQAVARGVAPFDFNNDGAPDILVTCLGGPVRLLRLQPTQPRHWLGLELREKHGRSAIGARVELQGPDGLQIREVRGGQSYLVQGDPRVLFGLGAQSDPGQFKLRIRWPEGRSESLTLKGLDQYLSITETAGPARVQPAGGSTP